MKTAIGIITVVQEGRFRLSREDGSSELYILHRNAPLEPQDLKPLAARGTRVRVRYEDAPGVVAGLAHDILPATNPAFARGAWRAGARSTTARVTS
ncbi:hypothetical protein [Lutibaculum baratangense]|nr:hypothetical protein [Lutibaculum baratangense]